MRIPPPSPIVELERNPKISGLTGSEDKVFRKHTDDGSYFVIHDEGLTDHLEISGKPPLPGAIGQDYIDAFSQLVPGCLKGATKKRTDTECLKEICAGYAHLNLFSPVPARESDTISRIASHLRKNCVQSFHILIVRKGERHLLKRALGSCFPDLYQLLGFVIT